MKHLPQIILAVILILASIAYAAWKTDRDWQAAYECRCGNADALFSTREGYLQTHLVSTALAILPIAAGIIFLSVFRPIGIVIIGFLIGVRLLTSLDARDAYAYFQRTTALVEIFVMIVALFIAFVVEMNNRIYQNRNIA